MGNKTKAPSIEGLSEIKVIRLVRQIVNTTK